MKIYQTVNKVMDDIAKVGVGKQGVNKQQGYKFRAWDDVQQALSPILARHGLLVIPMIDERHESQLKGKSDTVLTKVVLKGRIRLIAAEDGSELEIKAESEALDTSDKATPKALTMMVKYTLLHALCIPLEGVSDADEETLEVQSDEMRQAAIKALEKAASMEEVREIYKKMSQAMRSALTEADIEGIKEKFNANNQS